MSLLKVEKSKSRGDPMNFGIVFMCLLIMVLALMCIFLLSERERYRRHLEQNRGMIRKYRG